ncbi:uncharacterized protein LOC123317016 isoform X2 [Coccinella septempunctata]|uniref:uncharacterized protein LOC123317016 isoform X2 n=1 Tax=Coccinella septempunctata TaxID=41139 RepID=UPI001D07DC68|nr:uncharacterized protein LOC123317016 isoform X2 [Coccinella septempunctata]
MSDQLTDNLHNLNSWMNSRNLFLSPEKSRAIIFTKSGSIRSPPPPVMSGSTPIPWTTEHKYLGLHIESNLRWRKHVEMITGKISMANNIVKALCGKTWGAHPSVLMGVYKVLAVPHFDYGCLVYGRCSREVMLKLDRAQYAILRSALSMLKSTPTNILLFESLQPPLYLRRRWLATKYVSKALRVRQHPVLELIGDASDLRHLWFNELIPPFIAAIENLKNEDRIHRSETIPFFSVPLAVKAHQIRVYNSGLPKSALSNQHDFLQLIERRFPEHTLAFTDASVSRAPDSVGYGVFFPSMAVELSGRLPDHWSIFDAELFAIGKAVSEASERKLRRLLVVSDSLSALEALKSNKFDSSVDIISMRVRNTLYVANSTGCAVSCIWVPSHSYIHANDVADRLANQGRYADTAPHIPGGPQTLWPRIKRDIRGSWIEDFLKSCISRDSHQESIRSTDPGIVLQDSCALRTWDQIAPDSLLNLGA